MTVPLDRRRDAVESVVEFRRRTGMTQGELADILKITAGHLSRIEKGRRPLTARLNRALAGTMRAYGDVALALIMSRAVRDEEKDWAAQLAADFAALTNRVAKIEELLRAMQPEGLLRSA